MATPPPAVLFCGPQDVYDLIGTEGGQLRLDDQGMASGQTIIAVANAALGDMTLAITALSAPLLRGSVLEFLGAGMPQQIEVTLSAVAMVGATSLTVNPLSAAVFANSQAVDNGVNLATAYRLVEACRYGTSEVMLWCCARYDPTQLVLSYNVKRWATASGSKWLTSRRGQKPPASIMTEYEEAKEAMRLVQTGMLQIDSAGTRTSGWPWISNMTVDHRYVNAQVRVQENISEGTPTQYAQWVDWSSVFAFDY